MKIDKEQIVKTLTEIKAFYADNKELFDGFSGAVKLLLDAVKDTEVSDVADTFEWQMELMQSEKLLDEEIAQRKKGAELMKTLINLLLDTFVKNL